MYGMKTLVPSMNFLVNGFGFLLGVALLKELCRLVVVLADFVKAIHSFARYSGAEHTCLALWVRMWITDNILLRLGG